MLLALSEQVGKLLRERKLTLSIAESATGGLISSLITSIPGSSDYFAGGVVSYSNEIKNKLLGVRKATLEKYGAVSRQTAGQMASGVRKLMNTDIGISDTGIAGPGGATPGKPVGLYYIGLSTREKTFARKHLFYHDRLKNREKAAATALKMLLKYLSN